MNEQDQIDAIMMDIHEASMSSDPKDGCEARIAKALLVPFARVVTEEQERGSEMGHIYEGITRALLAIHLTALVMAEKKAKKRIPRTVLESGVRDYAHRLLKAMQNNVSRPPEK